MSHQVVPFGGRAAAIASAADYTPHWADNGNNHAWSVILDGDGHGSAGLFQSDTEQLRRTLNNMTQVCH